MSMLNKYDIRPGVFLSYPFSPEEDSHSSYKIGIVEGINRYDEVAVSNADDGHKEMHLKYFRPIEITEEYILAFTFEKADITWKDKETYKDVYALKFRNIIYVINKIELVGYCLYSEDPFGNRNFIKVFKHVHQLQSVFRELSGNNLPYKPKQERPF